MRIFFTAVVALLACCSVFVSAPSSAATNALPTPPHPVSFEEYADEMVKACGSDEHAKGYQECAHRFTVAQLSAKYLQPGAHSDRGAKFDQARDELYESAREAGSAARCGVINRAQSFSIMLYKLNDIFPNNQDGLLQAYMIVLSHGDSANADCSFWRDHPDRARGEVFLTHIVPGGAAAGDIVTPSAQDQAALVKFTAAMTKACGAYQHNKSYSQCADRFTTAQKQDGYLEQGAQSNRGTQYDVWRDKLYAVARRTGSAVRCGVITMDQSNAALDYTLGVFFPKNQDGALEVHMLDMAGDGLADPDCGLWRRNPDTVKAEQALVNLATKSLGR